MKLKVIALLFLAVSLLFAQSSGGAKSTTSSNAGAPSPTTCGGTNSYYVNTTNGDFYDCPSGTWVKAGNGGGSGTGTVTVVSSGSLTSTALVTGGGTQTLQTPSATSTLDSSGNMTLPGTVDLINNPFTALPGTAAAGHARIATVSNREVFSTNARVGGMFYPPNAPGVAVQRGIMATASASGAQGYNDQAVLVDNAVADVTPTATEPDALGISTSAVSSNDSSCGPAGFHQSDIYRKDIGEWPKNPLRTLRAFVSRDQILRKETTGLANQRYLFLLSRRKRRC